MVQKSYQFKKKSKLSPKSLAMFAIVFAIALPLVSLKIIHHKHSNYTKHALPLPELDNDNAPDEEEASTANEDHWETVTTQSGDTLALIFKRIGLNNKTLMTVLKNNPYAKTLVKIKTNQKIQFLIQNDNLLKLVFPISATQSLEVALQGERYISQIKALKMTSQNYYVSARLNGSLYGTARRMNIPYKLIRQMTEIFNWQIDFAKDVHSGDQFTIAYKAYFIENKLVGTGDILAVSYTNKGKTYQAVHHVSRSGEENYYSPQGTSLKKAFIRYPIKFSHISSTYNLSRLHPVLHYRRPHKGVDLAAPIGTPIHATGDGRITSIGRDNGYGNVIKVAHNQGYTTLYAHMLKFQKGLSKGDHIKRGDVIGYVGQSGLANGPHCHYEFHINQKPVNPSTLNLPHSAPIAIREMASFRANSNAILAQMKLYEEAVAAGNSNHSKKLTQKG